MFKAREAYFARAAEQVAADPVGRVSRKQTVRPSMAVPRPRERAGAPAVARPSLLVRRSPRAD